MNVVCEIPLKTKILLEKSIKKYRLRKFREKVYNNINIKKLNEAIEKSEHNDAIIFSNNKQTGDRFTVVSSLLCNRDVLTDLNEVMNLYLQYFNICNDVYKKINIREILSAWMISGCTEAILENIDSDEKYYVFEYSNKLIEYFKILNVTEPNIILKLTDFNKIFIHYYDTFTIFKEKDRLDKIAYFTREWMELEKTKKIINESDKYSNEQKNEVIKIIDKDKQMIEKYVKIFSRDFDCEKLRNIINTYQNLSKKITDNYKIILHKELGENNYYIFTKILNEIKNFLLIFNSGKKTEYDEKIDADFYSQLIETESIDMHNVCYFGDYIVNELVNLGSKSLEDTKINSWNKMKKNWKNDEIKYNISELLLFFMEIIEEIKNEINDYKILMEIIGNSQK